MLSQRPESTGSGLYVRSLIEEGTKAGHDMYLVAAESLNHRLIDPPVPKSKSTIVEFGSDRLPFEIPGMSDVMPYAHTRFRDMTDEQIVAYRKVFSDALIKSVDLFKPHIIHCHHLWIVTSLTAKTFPSFPVVATCHGSDLRQIRSLPRLRPYVSEGCSSLDGIMALTDAQRFEISSLIPLEMDKITVTGGGYRKDLFFPGDTPLTPPVRIAYAGKISSAKGIPWLVEALKAINLPWELHVAGSGEGEDGAICTELLRSLGSNVVLYGNVTPAKVGEIMRMSHLFALPSLHEGLPLVLLEALASGCRVVATELPGVKEVIKNLDQDYWSTVAVPLTENGERPLKREEPSFKEGLRSSLIAQMERVSEGNQPIDLSLSGFEWSSVFKRTEKAYEEALSKI
nr:glycosyltransferase family 4 protein [uncultured Dethiosulfovibrio sp.]